MSKNLNQHLKEFISKGKDIAYTAGFIPGVVRDAVGGAAKQYWKNLTTPVQLTPEQKVYSQKKYKEFNEQAIRKMNERMSERKKK